MIIFDKLTEIKAISTCIFQQSITIEWYQNVLEMIFHIQMILYKTRLVYHLWNRPISIKQELFKTKNK